MSVLIRNAQVCTEGNRLEKKHVLIEGDRIEKIVPADHALDVDPARTRIIEAEGQLLSAGLIDMHVHFREPGYEHKETIETGSKAAAKGGFTTVACMPNTRPVIDQPDVLKQVLDKAEQVGLVRVYAYACITRNQLGRELTDFAALKESGARGFTDDGVGVQSAQMMKDAMRLAASVDLPIIAHCEDDTLIQGAPVTEGKFAEKYGFKGIPNESEAIHVGRDILLAEATGVHYHVCHVSTEQSVRLIRMAKELGLRVTAEVCPHHLLLSDEDIPEPDANWKMNPPLRSPRDVAAVIEALEDGTIDILVTDHAPHSVEEKAKGMELAPFGIVGLETAFPLLYTHFVKKGRWTLEFLLDKWTKAPARVFGLDTGHLEVGKPADLVLIDLEEERIVDPNTFASKGRNTPFAGWKLQGWPTLTIVGGRVIEV
jgi:dihydroorotase